MFLPFVYEKKDSGFWFQTKYMQEIEQFPKQFSEIPSFYGDILFANFNYVDEQQNNVFLEENQIIKMSQTDTHKSIEKEINLFMSYILNSGCDDLTKSEIKDTSYYDCISTLLNKNNITNIDLRVVFKAKNYIDCVNKLLLLFNFPNNGYEKSFIIKFRSVIRAVTTLLIYDNVLNVKVKNSPCFTYLGKTEKLKIDTGAAFSVFRNIV